MFIIPWSEGAAASGANRLHIRTATERDVDGLAEYFGALSHSSRYNRFMGAVSNYSRIAFDCLVQNRKAERFTLIAEVRQDAREAVIGEASYAVEGRTGLGEFAISVCDGWQNRGLGSALLSALQSRAISLGNFGLYGETLKTNDQMKALARKAGFAFARSDDWRAIRFDKQLLDQPRDVAGARRTAPSLWWPRELTNTE
jgi:GNAT superfamily N-acetyltransferase